MPVLVPLFVSAFRRADDLATAMEARVIEAEKDEVKCINFVIQIKIGLVLQLSCW